MPPDTAIPRAASDVFRSWVSAGVGTVVSLPITFGYGLVQDRTGNIEVFALQAFSSLAIVFVSFGIYAIWTGRLFARATAAELAPWLAKSSRLTTRSSLVRIISGGGATSWAAQAALSALVAVVVLAFVPVLRTDVGVVVMGVLVVIISWLLVVYSYAVHYARENATSGGLEFPGESPPVWADYLYLSVQVSTTFSTSDVTVLSTVMRRHVSAHSLIAFAFNTVIVALAVSALLTFVPA